MTEPAKPDTIKETAAGGLHGTPSAVCRSSGGRGHDRPRKPRASREKRADNKRVSDSDTGSGRQALCRSGTAGGQTMRKYYIAPENCRWMEVEAATAEMAYSGICCWFMSDTRIAVIDAETGQAEIFTRTLDRTGNLTAINRRP